MRFSLALTATVFAVVPSSAAMAADRLVYFGTGGIGQGHAIFAAHLDDRTGHLSGLTTAAEIERPTWLLAVPGRAILYSVSEVGNDGKSQASVASFSIDRASGKLSPIASVAAGGGGATHLDLDQRSQTLFVANFGSGTVAAIPTTPDGKLSPPASVQTETGSGPHPRQKSAHPHGVTIDPTGRFLLVPDLGADHIFVYRFDPKTRALTAAPSSFLTPPGSGPRHLIFDRSGRFAYMNSELAAQITLFYWNARAGTLAPRQTVSTFPADSSKQRSTAEIRLSADGRFLYVSNRNEDTLVVYAVDPNKGTLNEIQRTPPGGSGPWSFTIAPGGQWLLVANQGSNTIVEFKVDTKSGKLTLTTEKMSIESPVNVTFAEFPQR